MPDGRIEFEITADGRRATATIQQITEELRRSGVQWEQNAGQAADGIGNKFKDMFSKLGIAAAAAKVGQALVNLGKEAIDAASDLEEVQNVVDVTFGDNANKIEAWAKQAGNQFGLTETQAKKFTSTLGAMMKSAGLAGDQVANMSTDLSGLAADMASFYNLDFDTAFQKIRAGISGETEPLKQLGINMSVANLNAFALEKGLKKTFDQMSQGEQVMLRYQYMMQATTDAQGDFSRTSDGFANATRAMETNIESLKTKLGQVLIPVVNDVIGGINKMITELTKKPTRTVLDDFADIDLNTEDKLAAVAQTSENARTLIDVLEQIGAKAVADKEDVSKILDDAPDGKTGAIPDLIDNITDIGDEALATKNKIDGIDKAFGEGVNKGVHSYLNKVGEIVAEATGIGGAAEESDKRFKQIATDGSSGVNKYQDGVAAIKSETVGIKDGVGDVDAEFSNKAAEGQGVDTYKKAVDGVKDAAGDAETAVANIDKAAETTTQTEALAGAVAGVGSAAEESSGKVTTLAEAMSTNEEAYSEWLGVCRKLVKEIPALRSIIDTETGNVTVDGRVISDYKEAIQVLRDYEAAWRSAKEAEIMYEAQREKQSALDKKFAELPELELEMKIADRKAARARKRLDDLLAGYEGLEANYVEDEHGHYRVDINYADIYGGVKPEDKKAIDEAAKSYGELEHAYQDAGKEFDRQNSAYHEAQELLAEDAELAQQEADNALESIGQWKTEMKDAAQESVKAFQDAAQAVQDYYSEARKATESQVNGVVKGFTRIKSASDSYKEAAGKMRELKAELEAGTKSQEEYNKEISELKEGLPTVQNMTDALKSQIEYMKEYSENLKTAREAGVSEELLASLSDGSEESALYLHALAEAAKAGDTKGIEELNKAWEEMNEGKESFTDTLTQQKLAVDETFQGMVTAAQEAAKGLDVSGEAEKSAGANISAIAKGISDHVPEVQEQVDAVLAILSQLNGWGISLEPTSWGTQEFTKPGAARGRSGIVEAEFATGTDYIPHDNFIASLHEGEAVLTAEENRVWQHLIRGNAGVDYDQLGGVMRDNINPGGDVYLDGSTVGKVVSRMQGNSYRTLTRSGWQS